MTTIDLRHVRTPEEAKRIMDEGLEPARRFARMAMEATGRGPLTDAEIEEAKDQQLCRWCHAPSIRWTACSCERGQEEARRIRAGA